MFSQEEFKEAILKAVKKAGSQARLAELTGMTQSRISDYSRGRFNPENISLGVMKRLFPEMKISFFNEKINTNDLSKSEMEKLIELKVIEALDDMAKKKRTVRRPKGIHPTLRRRKRT